MAGEGRVSIGPRDASEAESLERMKQSLASAGMQVQDVDDNTLLRFLRARSLDVSLASDLFLQDVQWRKEYLGRSGVKPPDIEDELKAKKMFVVAAPGQRPWIFFELKHHDSTARDLEQFKGLVVYVVEKAVQCLPPGEEKFGVVMDFGDTHHNNLEIQAMQAIFDILQAHYPERLHALLAIHVPLLFWGTWKVIEPMIDKVTRQKIKFVEDAELSKVFAEEVPITALPKEYGGEAELSWSR